MREHSFVDKHPIAASILMGILLMFIREIIASVFFGAHGFAAGVPAEPFIILYTLISSAAVFALYKWWFAPEFEGALKGGYLKEGLLSCWPFIVYWIITAIAMFFDHTLDLKPFSLTTIRVSLTAGFGEELAFRSAIISTLMRNRNRKELIISNCLISGAFFGLFHAFNVFAGADPLQTAFQVVTSACLGIFFAAVYLRYGNLWPCIIVHTLHDIYAISSTSAVSETGVVSGAVNLSSIVDVICCITMAVYALSVILSPQHRDKIVELWKRKWDKEEFTAIE